MTQGRYIHGRERKQLMYDLAEGNMTIAEIAEKYGKAVNTIDKFKARNLDEINQLAAGAMEYLDTLWVTRKEARVAVLQNQVERIDDALDLIDTEDIAKPSVRGETPPTPELMKIQQNALRAVSEELGQLPTRAQLAIEKLQVEYNVRGVNPEDVK